MKTAVKGLGFGIFVITLVFALITCDGSNDAYERVINLATIQGVTAPAVGGIPVTIRGQWYGRL